MKILFLASRFPYPLTQGDRLRAYHFLRLLSRNHQVTLVVPIQSAEEYQALPMLKSLCHQIEPIHVTRLSRVLNLIKAPFLPFPWQVTYYWDNRFHQKVKSLLNQSTFDIVHTQLARIAPYTQQRKDVPKALDFIDALSLNMARRAKHERGIRSWIFNAEAKRMRQYEQRLIDDFDQLMVCSAIDQQAIGNYKNLHIVPNGVDLSEFPYDETQRRPNTIIFTGNMSYFPNINAVSYFINEVLPKICAVIPDVQLIIVGPHLPVELQHQFQQVGVTLTGFVPSVHEYLSKAAVAIAPMQSGSGIQNKVLEAMATGTPVVATSYGVGGLRVESGKHLLIANSADEFAHSVVRLMTDRALNHEIVKQARCLIEQEFTWERAVEDLQAVYHKAIEQFKQG